MNLGWKHLAGQLLNGAELSQASIEEIDILLEEYPYFAGLHFLKAARLKETSDENLPATLSRAALYFPNPHWFALMLDHSVGNTMPVQVSAPLVIPQPEAMHDPEEAEPVGTVNAETTSEDPVEAFMPDTTEEELVEEPLPDPEHNWEQHLAENPVFQQHVVSDEEHFEQEIWHHQEQESTVGIEPVLASAEESETAEMVWEEEIVGEQLPNEEALIDAPEIPDSELAAVEPDLSWTPEEPEIPAAALTTEEPNVVPEPEAEPAQETASETPVPALDIPFEPLYTIDYFASQGIKIAAEASPKDQLSLKLRSFTEWLRAMKKLHPEKIDKDFNQDQEEQVRVIAEVSNEAQLVYTEAMAEVYIKQGKREKAREVFEKLSLLDPAKSAYFAVRIKELKEN